MAGLCNRTALAAWPVAQQDSIYLACFTTGQFYIPGLFHNRIVLCACFTTGQFYESGLFHNRTTLFTWPVAQQDSIIYLACFTTGQHYVPGLLHNYLPDLLHGLTALPPGCLCSQPAEPSCPVAELRLHMSCDRITFNERSAVTKQITSPHQRIAQQEQLPGPTHCIASG